MKRLVIHLTFMLSLYTGVCFAQLNQYTADNPFIQYVGRIDFSNPKLPRFYTPGVYIKIAFTGKECYITLHDEELWGKNHNYISYQVDNQEIQRIKLTQKVNKIKVAEKLQDTTHILTICKSTESNIGYLELASIECKSLVKLTSLPARKIEFIGNSITCGMGADASEIPCGKGEWYDQNNAFESYGVLTAQALNAQWHLTSYSGIGLMKSCCDLKLTMPQVFNKINLRDNTIPWDFNRYIPDVLSICLGQNDGIQNSEVFCRNYIVFIEQIRKHYPETTIILLSSPMADSQLRQAQMGYLTTVEKHFKTKGDKNIYHYVFAKQFKDGCSFHPDRKEHEIIAKELVAFIQKTKNW